MDHESAQATAAFMHVYLLLSRPIDTMSCQSRP